MEPGNFRPPEPLPLGYGTEYSTGTNCAGECAPQDWKRMIDLVEPVQLELDACDVLRDEALTDPPGRLIVAATKDGMFTRLGLARWQDGASYYSYCRVTLAKESQALLPLFETVCRSNLSLF